MDQNKMEKEIIRLKITVQHLIDALANQLIAEEGKPILPTFDKSVFYDGLKTKLASEGLKPIPED
jgi:hypothetical protein